jgi:hypothetical protein
MQSTRTIHRVVDLSEQSRETLQYWQSRPVGERLSAVWDLSEAAYSFAAAFRGTRTDDAQRPQRALTRVQR